MAANRIRTYTTKLIQRRRDGSTAAAAAAAVSTHTHTHAFRDWTMSSSSSSSHIQVKFFCNLLKRFIALPLFLGMPTKTVQIFANERKYTYWVVQLFTRIRNTIWSVGRSAVSSVLSIQSCVFSSTHLFFASSLIIILRFRFSTCNCSTLIHINFAVCPLSKLTGVSKIKCKRKTIESTERWPCKYVLQKKKKCVCVCVCTRTVDRSHQKTKYAVSSALDNNNNNNNK